MTVEEGFKGRKKYSDCTPLKRGNFENLSLRTSKQAWIKDRWWTQLSSDIDTRGRKDVFHVNEQKNPDSIYNVKARLYVLGWPF